MIFLGCYWGKPLLHFEYQYFPQFLTIPGTEKFFKSDFSEKLKLGKIMNGAVGFMGPPTAKKNPTYREVCTGTTEHVEGKNDSHINYMHANL